MNDLVDTHFPRAKTIRVVLDNLNTHTPGSFYASFPPEQARQLTRKLEFHYTPKHSSWLNMAEVEISVLTRQCLDQRLASRSIVETQTQAWKSRRNDRKATIDWQFSVPNARDKLRRLYPIVELPKSA